MKPINRVPIYVNVKLEDNIPDITYKDVKKDIFNLIDDTIWIPLYRQIYIEIGSKVLINL